MLLDDLPRALMQPPRSLVVAESAPGGQYVIFARRGERFDIRKPGKENPVMLKHGDDTRLLQHDFAEPDRVRIASAPPGKVATIPVVPVEQGAAKTAETLAENSVINLGRDLSPAGDGSQSFSRDRGLRAHLRLADAVRYLDPPGLLLLPDSHHVLRCRGERLRAAGCRGGAVQSDGVGHHDGISV